MGPAVGNTQSPVAFLIGPCASTSRPVFVPACRSEKKAQSHRSYLKDESTKQQMSTCHSRGRGYQKDKQDLEPWSAEPRSCVAALKLGSA